MDYAGLGQGALAAIDLVRPCTRALRRSLLSQSKSHALLLPVVDCVIFLQQWLPQNEGLFSQARRRIHRQQGGTTHQLHLLFVDHLHGCGPGVFPATEGHGDPTVQFKDQLWAFHVAAINVVDVIVDRWRHLPRQLAVERGCRSTWGTDEGGARVSNGHTGTVRAKGKLLAIHCDTKNLHLPESFVGIMDRRPLQGGTHVTCIVAAEANLTSHIVPFR
mmetsp:Transcript_46107/g.100415  ORF Transcript_46107/g.100415 Transcript_46107/m.100415 type:complete len:218 (-) Transcript_46107:727-1380(-)